MPKIGTSPLKNQQGIVDKPGWAGLQAIPGAVMAGYGALTGNPTLMTTGAGMFTSGITTPTGTSRGGGVGKLINPKTGLAYRSNEEVPISRTPLPWESGSGGNQPLTIPMPSGGGGGGGYDSVGAGRSGGASATPDEGVLSRYSTPSPEEQRHAGFVSDLARMLGGNSASMYGVSMPAYTQALKYYGDILGGNKAAVTQAIAPEAEMIAELTAGQERGIQAGALRGGARDTALAETARTGAGQIAGLIPKARQNAAAAGSQAALAGIGEAGQQAGAAGGLGAGLLGAAQQGRQFGISAEMQNRYQAAGIDLQWAQTALQEKLGMRGLDLQQMGLALNERLGQRGLDIQQMLGMGDLQLRTELGRAGINISQQQVDQLRRELDHKIKTDKGAALGNIGGAIIQALPLIMGSGGGGGSAGTSSGTSSGFGGVGGSGGWGGGGGGYAGISI